MLLYTPKAYNGAAELFEYAKVGLIPLNEQFIPIQHNGETLITTSAMQKRFPESGRRKHEDYIIDPEEILADHFSFHPDRKKRNKKPDVIKHLKQVLKTSLLTHSLS